MYDWCSVYQGGGEKQEAQQMFNPQDNFLHFAGWIQFVWGPKGVSTIAVLMGWLDILHHSTHGMSLRDSCGHHSWLVHTVHLWHLPVFCVSQSILHPQSSHCCSLGSDSYLKFLLTSLAFSGLNWLSLWKGIRTKSKCSLSIRTTLAITIHCSMLAPKTIWRSLK